MLRWSRVRAGCPASEDASLLTFSNNSDNLDGGRHRPRWQQQSEQWAR